MWTVQFLNHKSSLQFVYVVYCLRLLRFCCYYCVRSIGTRLRSTFVCPSVGWKSWCLFRVQHSTNWRSFAFGRRTPICLPALEFARVKSELRVWTKPSERSGAHIAAKARRRRWLIDNPCVAAADSWLLLNFDVCFYLEGVLVVNVKVRIL